MTTLKDLGNNIANTPITTLAWQGVQLAIIYYIVIPVIWFVVIGLGVFFIAYSMPSQADQQRQFAQQQEQKLRQEELQGGTYSQDEYKRQCLQMKMNCNMVRP